MKHIAKKKFGQNFLIDQGIIQSLINAISPQADDLMVEIGPGLGAMTQPLIKHLDHLHVVEIDRDIIQWMQGFYPQKKITIHNSDVLKFDFATIGERIRVVGNLPYNISSPILFKLLENTAQIIDMQFMLQKEVVERMVAEPGSKTYGRLSVMLQWRYHMELMFVVPPTAFDPPPRVDSAIVRMIPLPNPLPCDQAKLEQVVLKAFSQRRKVIRNCLSGMFTESDLLEAGVDPQARPETIPLEQYVALANRL